MARKDFGKGYKGGKPHAAADTDESDDEPEYQEESSESEGEVAGDEEDSDEGGVPVQSLFGPEMLPSASAFWKHAAEAHGLSLAKLRQQIGVDVWDDYHRIRLVNFLRKMGPEQARAAVGKLGSESELWKDDSLLLPVLQDDPLLFDDDGLDGQDDDADDGTGKGAGKGAGEQGAGRPDLRDAGDDEAAVLRQEVVRLHEEIYKLREMLTEAEPKDSGGRGARRDERDHMPSGKAGESAKADGGVGLDDAASFLRSRARLFAHDARLAGAVKKVGGVFEGQRVLDVGCGAGVVSCLCASLGAASVVGVDTSAEALQVARSIADANAVASKATFVHEAGKGRASAGATGGYDMVVGGGLLTDLRYGEGLLDLLSARRRLRPGGRMVPSSCKLCICAADYSPEAALSTAGDSWQECQKTLGLDLTRLGACAIPQLGARGKASAAVGDPVPATLEGVSEAQISSIGAQELLDLDTSSAAVEDALPSGVPFRIQLRPDRCTTAIVLYLDAVLAEPLPGEVESVKVSAAPQANPDDVRAGAARQLVLHLPSPGPPLRPLCLPGSSFEALDGTLSMTQRSSGEGRALQVEIAFTAVARGREGGGLRAGGKFDLPP